MGSQKTKKPWFRKPSIEVSNRMKCVKSKDTSIEKSMEILLKSQEIGYEKQPSIAGNPDFKIRDGNVLIFCDSSFWHGRRTKEVTGEAFKKNKRYWVNKLLENRKRDARINRALRKEGWKVLRFWDTDIFKYPEKIIKRLRLEIQKND